MTIDETPVSSPKTALSPKPQRSKLVLLLLLIAGCFVFFSLTSPKSVPSLLLVLGFVVLGLLLFCILKLLMIVSGLQSRITPAYRRGLLLAGTALPVLLLMLQSIGQLTIRDALTLGGLFALGVFYVSRVTRARS